MKTLRVLLVAAGLLLSICAAAQTSDPQPHLGYFYPSGARQGTTAEVVAGGQYLRSAKDVIITGSGVTGKIVQHFRPFNPVGDNRRPD